MQHIAVSPARQSRTLADRLFSRWSWLGVLGAVVSAGASMGCQGIGVGDPCIPEDEYRVQFGGYSKDEVNIESRSFQCETRVCLVNKFQGRVSCPYGTRKEGSTCRTPDDTDNVTVEVTPQLTDRRPNTAVYCSCRCDGAQSNAPYCECPEGFSCENLIDDIGLGNAQLAGSYCVKNGTEKEADAISGEECNIDRNKECGEPDSFN